MTTEQPTPPAVVLSTAKLGPTHGPWQWADGVLVTKDGQCILWPQNVPGGDGLDWAQNLGACGLDTERQAEENAKLMAAAPELLDALKHIRRCIPIGGFAQIHYGSSTWEQIDAAITKAVGDVA